MSFLLDTNVVSEWMKPQPNPGVVTWLADTDEDRIFISVVTLAELRYGIERLAIGNKRKRLDDWLQHELILRFEERILPIDISVADAAGKVVAQCESVGRPVGAMDAFIAATAQVHQMTLVTRNISDFEPAVKSILNPWI